MAVAEFRHFEQLRARLEELGVDPEAAMEPFVAADRRLPRAHGAVRPGSRAWSRPTSGDGIASDFYREISAFLDPATHALVTNVVKDSGQAEFVVREVRAAIEADPRVAGRLALWGRRLVGEALSQAQRVAADRDGLAALLVGSADRPGRRPRRAGADVRPAHRGAHPADGHARPGRLTPRARRNRSSPRCPWGAGGCCVVSLCPAQAEANPTLRRSGAPIST